MASILGRGLCQLWDHHVVLNIQHRGDDPASQGGQVIDVGMAYLAQQAVQAKPFQKAANTPSTPALEQGVQATRSQAGQRMLSAQERLEYRFVFLQEGIEPPITAALLIMGR